MALCDLNVASPKAITASGNVKVGPGALLGIFCASGTTPTITVYDDAAAGTAVKIVDTFTPVPGTWYPLPMTLTSGCNIVLGGTASITAVVL